MSCWAVCKEFEVEVIAVCACFIASLLLLIAVSAALIELEWDLIWDSADETEDVSALIS